MTAMHNPVVNTFSLHDATRILRERYGFESFRGTQAEVILHTLAGGDSLVLMPTGGGKSLCYQIPALLRSGVGIVVSPLIALMQDQVDALIRLDISAAFLNSSQSPFEQRSITQALTSGQLDVLYVAPERLLMEDTLSLLAKCEIALFAIDEAHCVSQWGHDFRKDYLGLHILGERFPGVPRMALTATADRHTREEIIDRLALTTAVRFVEGFDRPNIRYTVAPKSDVHKQLARFLSNHNGEAGIVYCQSRARVEKIAAQLSVDGITALPYHAGLPADTRRVHQARFLREEGVVMVATIAFGMGIDKPDVRFVVHLDLPKSMEAYYQETGRAGRDGEPAEAWMIYGLQDVVRQRQMVDSGDGNEDFKRIERGRLDALLGWCEMTTCRRRALLTYFDDDPTTDCGNCDNCLSPPDTWDATEPAQQLMSCIYRTGQRFGAGHVLDVLLARSTEKTTQHRHESLSTWGIGRSLGEPQWRSILRQLVVQGYVWSNAERYGALCLHESARALLRGEATLVLRRDLPTVKSNKTTNSKNPGKKATRAPVTLGSKDEPLWEALRQCRRTIAEREGVPPYVVFHDATLLSMIELRPTSMAQMMAVHGVGQKRLERYGAEFLDILSLHRD
jgi:ATP-dependent DNA helicase RecQ